MADRKALEHIAARMAGMLLSDSNVEPGESMPRILQGLIRDDRIPTEYEMECLVLGGPLPGTEGPETDGEGNPEVDRLFPYTGRAIRKFFR